MVENKVVDKSRDKLVSYISKEITSLFGNILDFTEVAVGDKDRYRVLRQKILKISNDTIRNVSKEITERYDVNYDPPVKEILVLNKKSLR